MAPVFLHLTEAVIITYTQNTNRKNEPSLLDTLAPRTDHIPRDHSQVNGSTAVVII
jgi:hypothetical protein